MIGYTVYNIQHISHVSKQNSSKKRCFQYFPMYFYGLNQGPPGGFFLDPGATSLSLIILYFCRDIQHQKHGMLSWIIAPITVI